MDFKMLPTVNIGDDAVVAALLGASPGAKLTGADIGKALKLAGDSRYDVCADGDDIEAMLWSVEPHTAGNGYGFGSVQKEERIVAQNKGAGAIAVGAYVVAAAQPAVGTAIAVTTTGTNVTGVRPMPVKAGAGVLFKWRVVSLPSGSGAVDALIVIEKIN